MSAALPTPDDCRCECASTVATPTGAAVQQLFYSAGPPVGLQVGVNGLQDPRFPAFCTDVVANITYRWDPFMLTWS